ncbi:hypothetical protein pdam_00024663 [Pocillopora damicornis]|uniref:Uncharacterized protein n=1 Tax=Pocillopora damicornis TaxID=46731 RepID=A0A3M6UD46_POCDA|nr:hypothetical protein pdam_00024663 [Pocillopora damicornis]
MTLLNNISTLNQLFTKRMANVIKYIRSCESYYKIKKSFLNPPSKLLYRFLATSDLLVGLVSQPLFAAFSMTLV